MRSPIVEQVDADKAGEESLSAAKAGCRPQALAGGARERYLPKRLRGWRFGKLLQFTRSTSGAINSVMTKISGVASVPNEASGPWQIGQRSCGWGSCGVAGC